MSDRLAEVLELVNKAREALGKEPLEELPRGKQHQPTSDVIARALDVPGAAVGIRYVRFPMWRDGRNVRREAQAVGSAWGMKVHAGRAVMWVDAPDVIRNFVNAFDRGDYPQLTIDLKEVWHYAR